MEVIYTGLRVSLDMIATTAVQEDVDLICVSILSGSHNVVFGDLMVSLQARGGSDIPILGGGVIPNTDITHLKKLGVREVFTVRRDHAVHPRAPGTLNQRVRARIPR